MRLVAVPKERVCVVGWGGCDNYSGTHLCDKLKGYASSHRCGWCGRYRKRNVKYDRACS